tara:strand:- start:338 stop:613 length:276 start_codon:yes stop_codon:yes gene_type:complete
MNTQCTPFSKILLTNYLTVLKNNSYLDNLKIDTISDNIHFILVKYNFNILEKDSIEVFDHLIKALSLENPSPELMDEAIQNTKKEVTLTSY